MPDGKVTLILFCCLCNAASVRYGDKLLVTYYTIAIILISIFFFSYFYYVCMVTQYSFFEHLLKERACPYNRQKHRYLLDVYMKVLFWQ